MKHKQHPNEIATISIWDTNIIGIMHMAVSKENNLREMPGPYFMLKGY